ncbi:MAG: hypothetical protein HY909_17125 [Deltaproteobacteria bacterium]|nr:hypothetical protein [Deltaproteobacteria bacterium]
MRTLRVMTPRAARSGRGSGLRSAEALCLALAAFFPAEARAQGCVPTTELSRQYRTRMKHRAPVAANATPVTVTALLGWAPPAGVEDPRLRERDAPVDAREEQVLVVDGDLWRVKLEDNDCDFHLEISAPGAGPEAPRLVAEVPYGAPWESARAVVLAAVGRASLRRGDRVDLSLPVRVRLTGLAFWDGAHWCHRDGARGCGHGTPMVASLWELHPVWRVEVAGASAPRPSGTVPWATMTPIPAPQTPLQAPLPRARARCCDGTFSPTCGCDRVDFRRCCRGHGGVCGGCGR